MSDLVERLRRNRWCDATTGKFTSPPTYDLAGVEAERLDAADEIERLQTALQDIVDNCLDNCECSGAAKGRRALEPPTH